MKKKIMHQTQQNGNYNNCIIKKDRSLINVEHNMQQVHPGTEADLLPLGRAPQRFASRDSYLSVLSLRLRNSSTNGFYFILVT